MGGIELSWDITQNPLSSRFYLNCGVGSKSKAFTKAWQKPQFNISIY